MNQAFGAELVERTVELGWIDQMLTGAVVGAGSLLFVEGEAGIGKTGLARAACARAAAHGMRVRSAQGGELEQALPFGVVRGLLAQEPDAMHDGSLLVGAAALAASVLSPTAPSVDGGPDAYSVLHGLYWVAAGLGADAPTLLVVDDAHLCDAPSLKFLAYLARRLDGLPIALLVAMRPAISDPQRDLLRVLADVARSEVVRPRPLSDQAVSALIEEALGPAPDAQFIRACSATTGGNPFLIRELIAELKASAVTPTRANTERVSVAAPHEVQRAILTRLAQLPVGCTALARAAAVLGDGVNRRQATRLAGLTDERTGLLVDRLAKARILERKVTLTFVHPLVRTAVLSNLGPVELADAHHRAAALMRDDPQSSDRVVTHLLATEGRAESWVVYRLRDAARRAVARGAPEVAAQYLQRALAEPPPTAEHAALLLELGTAEAYAGIPAAIDHMATAAEQSPNPVDRARASLSLTRALFLAGRTIEAVDVARTAIDELGDRDQTLALELEVELVSVARHDIATRPLALRRLAQRTADPQPHGPAECTMLANLAIEEAAAAAPRERVVDLAERALTDSWLFETRALATVPLVVHALDFTGHAQRALEVCNRALANHRARGEVQAYAVISAFRCYTLRQLGDVTGAVADGRAAVELAAAHNVQLIHGYAAAWLALALIDAGDHMAAAEVLDNQIVALNGNGQFAANSLLSARGHLRLAQGRPDKAIDDLVRCGQGLAAWSVENPWLCPWRPQHALALHTRGNHAAAREAATTALDEALSWGAPYFIVEALRVAALTEPSGPKQERAFRRAAESAEAHGSPLDQARTQHAYGSTMRRAGRRADAKVPLRRALDLAMQCGGTGIAQLAHDELVACGAQPRRLRTTGVQALTPTERRIAGLVAPGMTNREIAQALFVAEKTVETHLSAVYRKLDISSRSQLERALGEGPVRTTPGTGTS